MRKAFCDIHHMVFMLLLLLAAAVTTSCSESDDDIDTEYQNWTARNNEYFENIYQTAKAAIDAGDNSWKIIKSFSKVDGLSVYTPGSEVTGSHTSCIVVRVINEVESGETPCYTDTVRVHYYGCLMPSASYSAGKKFDSSWSGLVYDEETAIPAKLPVAGTVDGFTTALQSMRVGDHWEVYIPWQLGYGSPTSNSAIPDGSTLRFDMPLVTFCKAGTPMPPYK